MRSTIAYIVVALGATSTPLAAFAQGAPLTEDEIAQVKQQIARCWNIPVGATDVAPQLRLHMNQDGTVGSADLLHAEWIGNPSFLAAAQSALRAVSNPHCSPLKLPPERYDQWQTLTITFDPKDPLR